MNQVQNQPTTVTAATLEVPDANLYYEVRGNGPLLVLVGAPMGASAFAPLADELAADHTVLTTDPRGINRSRVADPDQDSTPETRADDLARLVTHLDAGPASVFGSSGGAVSALALVQAHPELMDTVIAHEPPLLELLEDRASQRAATDDMVATHLAGDPRGAFVKFLASANLTLPDEAIDAMVAGDPGVVADNHFMFAHMLRPTTRWLPDLAGLRAVPGRIVIGLGDASGGQLCERTSRALASALGRATTAFPGGHVGFVEDPSGFADRLRTVLHR